MLHDLEETDRKRRCSVVFPQPVPMIVRKELADKFTKRIVSDANIAYTGILHVPTTDDSVHVTSLRPDGCGESFQQFDYGNAKTLFDSQNAHQSQSLLAFGCWCQSNLFSPC